MGKNNHNQVELLNWTMTPWLMNGQGGWKQQPVILIEGQVPFFADTPQPYIEKLREMHSDKTLAKGPNWTYIGQLKDGMEQVWDVGLVTLVRGEA